MHDQLGMDLDYSGTRGVKFLMIKYLQKVLDYFTEALRGMLHTLVV